MGIWGFGCFWGFGVERWGLKFPSTLQPLAVKNSRGLQNRTDNLELVYGWGLGFWVGVLVQGTP